MKNALERILKFAQYHRFLLEAITIIVVAVIVGVLVFFYDRLLGPSETGTPIVINEVYPAFCERNAPGQKPLWICPPTTPAGPQQWFELYNRTGAWQNLSGWSVEMTPGEYVPLPDIELPPYGYAVVAASKEHFPVKDFPGYIVYPATWPGLDRQFLILRDAQGQVVDAVNWGPVAEAPAGVTLWEKPALGSGGPWIVDGKTGAVVADHSLERRPTGVDRNIAADWMRQPFPSPGTVNEPSGTAATLLLFTDWTNVVSLSGGILLWIAFIYVALIARRFEALTQQRTLWQAMLLAPSGILFYIVVQSYGFRTRGSMTIDEQWWGFVVLFVSALLCTGLVFLFRQRAKKILEG